MKNYYCFISAVFLLFIGSLYGQSVKQETRKYFNKVIKPVVLSQAIESGGYDLTRSLPKGYTKNGDVDYTEFIQQAITRYRTVIFPNFPILVNDKGLTVSSNSVLFFHQNSKIILKPSRKIKYEVLRLHNVKNVKIYNLSIVADAKSHLGKTGEWGMGISIRGAQNIEINNCVIKNCWGDAVYIGNGSQENYNIRLVNGILDNNRRNGISIITGRKIVVSNVLISNTRGTRPMAGIDIEPNNINEKLKEILLENIVTVNNMRGILLALNHLNGNVNNQIDVSIRNHTDENSDFALGLSLMKKVGRSNVRTKLSGIVRVDNPRWINNKEPIQYYDLENNKVKVQISNLNLIDQRRDVNHLKRLYKLNSGVEIGTR